MLTMLYMVVILASIIIRKSVYGSDISQYYY